MFARQPAVAAEGAPKLGHELLGVAHDLLDPGEGAVPLEHRELGVVTIADFPAAKDVRNLELSRHAGDEQTFHLVLGRRDQIAAARPPRRRDGDRAREKGREREFPLRETRARRRTIARSRARARGGAG